ncbi:MAG: CDP-diacylglycerol--glycerol-3-phosphate 3-phosphatidyltransferase [Treponema sp.]|jgi:CDP-diacylglycerol--glycerol-3-phosphate 3-phosphatidyltransferase|nr:CDP-diacylglycerol--glycerol-3-phosphate 3-phosphatidyltransferase [Treponema sp.]
MTVANKLTFLRIILAPLFFVIYRLPGTGAVWAVPVLWFIYIVSEVTDLLDGFAARKYNEVSDFGKFFDPFADTLTQLGCFLCFVLDGIFPAILYLLVIYREFSILFIRNLMLRKGVAMGARMSGKIKTVAYIIAGGAALLFSSLRRLSLFERLFVYIRPAVIIIFLISVVFSVISFFDYLSVYRKAEKNAANPGT